MRRPPPQCLDVSTPRSLFCLSFSLYDGCPSPAQRPLRALFPGTRPVERITDAQGRIRTTAAVRFRECRSKWSPPDDLHPEEVTSQSAPDSYSSPLVGYRDGKNICYFGRVDATASRKSLGYTLLSSQTSISSMRTIVRTRRCGTNTPGITTTKYTSTTSSTTRVLPKQW